MTRRRVEQSTLRLALAFGALVFGALVTGCREQRGVRWEVAFADPGLAARAVVVEAEVRRGACGDSGEDAVVWRASRERGEAFAEIPVLAEGTHSFIARASDVDCVVFASGCAEVTLPAPDETVVRTLLEATTETPACDQCTAGRCEGVDAGSDAAPPPDAGPPPDTGPPIDAGPAPPVPLLRAPRNGAATGSVHAAASIARHPLRPRFRWEPSAGATHYELEIDDGCARAPSDACFDAPMVERTAATEHVPAADLSVSTAPPVGRRYFWRVRACAGPMDARASCSAYSPVRWLDVGRLDDDFDGDGYSDLAVGAPTQDGVEAEDGFVYVFAGRPGPPSTSPTATVEHLDPEPDAWFGSSISAGDVDGDGYADALIGAEEDDTSGVMDAGAAYLLYGGPSGLEGTGRRDRLEPATPDASAYFGQTAAVIGDADGDGFRDLVVGAGRFDDGGLADRGVAYVYAGRADGVATAPTGTLELPRAIGGPRFGMTVAAAGDVDGDGHADVLVAAPYEDADGASDRGRVYLFFGSPSGFGAATEVDPSVTDTESYFGWAMIGGADFDDDGFSDFVIGAPWQDAVPVNLDDRGFSYVFHGARGGPPATPEAVVPDTRGHDYTHAGWAFAAGDFDGDGFDDLAIGEPAVDYGGLNDVGVVSVRRGSSAGLGAVTEELEAPAVVGNLEYGRSLSAGDFDGDGRSDLAVGAHQWRSSTATPSIGRVYVYRAASGWTSPLDIPSPTGQTRGRFGWSMPTSVGRFSDVVGHTPDG